MLSAAYMSIFPLAVISIYELPLPCEMYIKSSVLCNSIWWPVRVLSLTNSFIGSVGSPPSAILAYSLGVVAAGPFLNILGSPSSITKLDPVSLDAGISVCALSAPIFTLGLPGLLSSGPGVLNPNTILGTSRLALEVVVPLI